MNNSKITVEHVRLTTDRRFDDVTAAFVRGLGKFDAEVYKDLVRGHDPQATRAGIQAMVGPSGFMLFNTNDHGSLLGIVGHARKAVQYVVGNPLFAIEMTRYDIRAALYAPLRVLIYEDGPHTCIEYDKPSSLFGQFGNERVNETAAMLDRKLADLTAEAIR
jgi:uncharacterized protein (DUF302 family)